MAASERAGCKAQSRLASCSGYINDTTLTLTVRTRTHRLLFHHCSTKDKISQRVPIPWPNALTTLNTHFAPGQRVIKSTFASYIMIQHTPSVLQKRRLIIIKKILNAHQENQRLPSTHPTHRLQALKISLYLLLPYPTGLSPPPSIPTRSPRQTIRFSNIHSPP